MRLLEIPIPQKMSYSYIYIYRGPPFRSENVFVGLKTILKRIMRTHQKSTGYGILLKMKFEQLQNDVLFSTSILIPLHGYLEAFSKEPLVTKVDDITEK